MRAVVCALLCNCRHTLRADDDEGLMAAALEHLRRCHPAAPLGEERIRDIVYARAYEIEQVRDRCPPQARRLRAYTAADSP
jgi:predicted small metal-binding protein